MKLHPRTLPVQGASAELRGLLIDFQGRHDLTNVEMLRILIDEMQSITKYMLRAERHPNDPDAKADEAVPDDQE
jgi:hypothetical protein